MGYPVSGSPTTVGSQLAPISTNGLGGKGEATAKMSIQANLDASADPQAYTTGQMYGGQVTPQFQTTINVYDSQGGTQPLQISYVKTAANTWSYEVAYTGNQSNITPTGGTDPNPIATGTLQFDQNGAITGVTPTDPNSTATGGTLGFKISVGGPHQLRPFSQQQIAFNMGNAIELRRHLAVRFEFRVGQFQRRWRRVRQRHRADGQSLTARSMRTTRTG